MDRCVCVCVSGQGPAHRRAANGPMLPPSSVVTWQKGQLASMMTTTTATMTMMMMTIRNGGYDT